MTVAQSLGGTVLAGEVSAGWLLRSGVMLLPSRRTEPVSLTAQGCTPCKRRGEGQPRGGEVGGALLVLRTLHLGELTGLVWAEGGAGAQCSDQLWELMVARLLMGVPNR